jgi:hypothetical protein
VRTPRLDHNCKLCKRLFVRTQSAFDSNPFCQSCLPVGQEDPSSVSNMLDVIRLLRDMSVTGLPAHRVHGKYPGDLDVYTKDRDPNCQACAVLIRADEILGGTS